MKQGEHDNQQYNNAVKKKKGNAPSLDQMYNNEYESKIKKYDQELDGEIQHESLKKNLEEQYQNQRVEFTAQDPAALLKQKTMPQDKENGYQSYAMSNDALGGAEAEMGNYDDGSKPKKKKKKKRKTVVEPPTELVGEPHVVADADDQDDDLQGNYLNQQERIPATHNLDDTEYSSNWSNSDQPAENEEAPPLKKKKSKKKKHPAPVEYDEPEVRFCLRMFRYHQIIQICNGAPLTF
jgi:hypothetical protein